MSDLGKLNESGGSSSKNYKSLFDVLLAPTAELAKTLQEVPYSVEAEYGEEFIPGKEITFAHHGPRSNNPAPCEQPNQECEPGTILISHIDLDTIGGIMAIEGEKNDKDSSFWKSVAYIDVNGPHHMHEIPEKDRDKINAYLARANKNEKLRTRYTDIATVTPIVKECKDVLSIILDENHPLNEKMISEGKEWAQETTEKIEEKLVYESDKFRAFVTDNIFCGAAYYSPKKGKIIPCTLTYNEKFKAITLAFSDETIPHSACEIMQELFGPKAGGRKTIAGSPRGEVMTMEDFERVKEYLENIL